MLVRFFGGPKHNQTDIVREGYVELVKAVKLPRATFLNSGQPWDMLVVPKTKRGRYYLTPEIDKNGNQIMAWTGWR